MKIVMITERTKPHREFDDLLMSENRKLLLKHLPLTEKKLKISGVSTTFLAGGNGPTIILLHGPGENALWWMRIVPGLVITHKLIIPDLPGHAASKVIDNHLEPQDIYSWLSDLIKNTCEEPPVLVGHVLGGAIAARYASAQKRQISKLVLVDSLGLGKFRPSLSFAFRLIRFMFQSTQKNYNHFLPLCLHDIEQLKRQMGEKWEQFIAYNLECYNNPDHKTATQTLMKKLGIPKISSNDLSNIRVPTTLIWGRHDRANKLEIAQAASRKYNWPLYVIDETRDDPKLERPEKFVEILMHILTESK